MCYLHEIATKIKACHEHRKTHDLINKKNSFDSESLIKFWAILPTKTGTGWSNIKKFCRHDRIEVVFFRTRIGSIMQRWCNSSSVGLPTKAFAEMLNCVEALDHVCPQFLWDESLLGFEQRWYVGWKALPQSYFSVFARVS